MFTVGASHYMICLFYAIIGLSFRIEDVFAAGSTVLYPILLSLFSHFILIITGCLTWNHFIQTKWVIRIVQFIRQNIVYRNKKNHISASLSKVDEDDDHKKDSTRNPYIIDLDTVLLAR